MSDSAPIPSPYLDTLLRDLRRALTRQVWLHGLGSVACGAALWLLFMYGADRWLHLPGPVRVIHSVVLLLLPAFLAHRHLARPLGRIPDRAGLARLLERAHPGSSDLLVSAVQLAPDAAGSPARELIALVVADAEQHCLSLSTNPVLDRSGPRRRLLAGLGTGVLSVAALAAQPHMARIFLQRMSGSQVPWPQQTHLFVEVPPVGQRLQVEVLDDEIRVRAARGSDVSILVRVEGEVPPEVFLHFSSGHRKALVSGGTPLFRTLLRSVQEDLEFYVTGGDDEDGLPRVRISVLQPPDVAGIAWEVTPPAYSGLPPVLSYDPDVEVLEGSHVRVTIQPTPVGAEGSARLLPEDRIVPLVRGPFPSADAAAQEGAQTGLAFELDATLSARVSFDLVDPSGLPNPDPGLYAMTVIEDRRPEVFLLAPSRADVDVVAGGAVPLRVRVEDDYGLADLTWDLRASSDPDKTLSQGTLDTEPVETDETSFAQGGPEVRRANVLLEVDELTPGGAPLAGFQWTLQVLATDNREPQAGVSPSAPVRLRVVSGDEFLRHLKDHLARAGDRAGDVYALARSQRQGTQILQTALIQITGDTSPPEDPPDFGSLVHGARRMEGDARALARDLAQLTEGLLYSRIDSRGNPLLDMLESGLATQTERGFDPAPWLALGRAYRAGDLGQAELAGDLVEIVGLALEVSEQHGAAAASHLAGARETSDPSEVLGLVEKALASQTAAQETLDQLLAKLGEWDNFQSILTLTRDILNHQKNLEQRTRRLAEDH